MKKRILAFALTLAMVVGSLSMLSFVTFAEEPAAEPSSTVLEAGFTAKDPVDVGAVATATATYSIAKNTISIVVTGTGLATVNANVGGYEAAATATEDTATITVAISDVIIYENASSDAVADLQIAASTAEDDGTFDGTLVFVTDDATDLTAPLKFNTSGAAAANKKEGVFVGGNTGSENYGKLIYKQANGEEPTPDCYFSSLGSTYIQNGTRRVFFDITITDMTPVDVSEVTFTSYLAAAQAYDKINLHFGSNAGAHGSIIFNLVNTTNGGSDGEASLVLAYYNAAEKKNYVLPLDRTVGEKFKFEFLWDTPFYGYVKIDDKVILEKDNILSGNDIKYITSGTTGGPYFRVVRGSETGTAAFNFQIDDLTLNIKTHLHSKEKLFAAASTTVPVKSSGNIKLSYVQKTISPIAPVNGTGLSNDVVAGQGGTYADGVFTIVGDGAKTRAYSQGGFEPLGNYGNRTISFKVNVEKLTAYDFSKGGTLEGDAKYTENLVTSHGENGSQYGGIGTDLTVSEFEKMLIGATAKVTADGKYYSTMIYNLVNDTKDGLVLIHTAYDGTMTVIKTDKSLGEDIDVTIVWNKNDTGSVTVAGKDAVSLDDCKTIRANFSGTYADTATQCYFSSYGASRNGYFGFNAVSSTMDTKAVLSNLSATVSNPFDARFIATIDTLDAKEAGFEINIKDSSKVVKMNTNTVYNAIYAKGSGDLERICANDGEYFVALTVKGVPATGTVTFVVKPYFTYGESTTYGTAYEVTYTDGAFVSCVPAN